MNASELSILDVILTWLGEKSSSRAVATLLSRIDFGQIRQTDLQSLLASTQNENFLSLLREKQLQCDELIHFRDEQGLLNLRGMQLSIVKVIAYLSNL